MGPLGRFSVAALHCLFSLAAFKAYVASGSPAKAAYGDGDFASRAVELIHTDPNAAAGASVTDEADSSLLARKQEVNPHKTSMVVNPEGDGELHHGTLDDDDGVAKRVVIRADGSLAEDVVDEVSVRSETLQSAEPTNGQAADGQQADAQQADAQQADAQQAGEIAKNAEDALDANATKTADAPAPTPEPEEESDNTAVIIIVVVLLLICIPAVVVGCLMKNKSEHAPPSALF